MRSATKFKHLLTAGVALAAASLCASAGRAQTTPQGMAAPLPEELMNAAAVYDAYMHRATAINPAFASGAAVAASVRVAAGYEPRQLEAGEIAYGALVALRDPAFADSVRQAAADPGLHQEIVDRLLHDPSSVVNFAGADGAAVRVAAALRSQGEQLFSTGKAVKQAAYDVQHQAWSKGDVPDPQGRLAEAKSLSASPVSATAQDMAQLGGDTAVNAGAETAPAYTPVVERSLALAALAIMSETGGEDPERLSLLLSEAKGADCMKMAKLNLFQCLAVAGPHYEDIFCLGQHALMDTGRCVVAQASAPDRPTQMAQAQPVSRPTDGSR